MLSSFTVFHQAMNAVAPTLFMKAWSLSRYDSNEVGLDGARGYEALYDISGESTGKYCMSNDCPNVWHPETFRVAIVLHTVQRIRLLKWLQ